MSEKFEVCFNSPQCGWMSVGFSAGSDEFHTTTAHAPHERALSELLAILSEALVTEKFEKTLKWNRNPEEFDFMFRRNEDELSIEIIEFPTANRDHTKSEKVFSHKGNVQEIASAFCETFQQLYEERDADEFEQNWHQPFPDKEFKEFKKRLG